MKALILSPDDASYTRVRETIEQSLRESGFEFIGSESLLSAGNLYRNAIFDAIHEADIIIADVTGSSSQDRSNIMFELGLASGLRKPMILLLSTKSEGSLPEDFARYQILIYDPDELSPMQTRLVSYLHHLYARRAPSP
jgi:nucleoside 2-deoxyribosyltransferase